MSTEPVEQFEQLLHRIAGPELIEGPPSGLGNPGPLGLGAFALSTFTLSVFNTRAFIDVALEPVIIPVAFFYGGIVQFAAGMWEFRTNNTFGATVFASYGAFWISFATYLFFIVPRLEATGQNVGHATGLFLFSWLLFTLYMTVASFRVSRSLFVIFTLLCVTFLLLTIGEISGIIGWTKAGGWVGLVAAFAAWYGSAAVIINTTFGEVILPVFPYQRPPIDPEPRKPSHYGNHSKNGHHAHASREDGHHPSASHADQQQAP